MNVIKKNGKKELLDINKIHKQTVPACDGLDNVSVSELEVSAQIHMRDGVLTSDIQKALIKSASDLIDVDRPNWTFVASRLLLNDIYKLAYKYSTTLSEYIDKGIKDALVSPLLKVYTPIELKELDDYIKTDRDLLLTYQGTLALRNRYLNRKAGDVIESPQTRFMTVAMFLALGESDRVKWAKDFYDILSKLEVMTATPTLLTAGKTHTQLSSCYVLDIPDNIEGITTAFSDFSILSKFGAGVGANVSQVRGANDAIRGVDGASAGVIPQIKVFNDLSIYFDQLGVRNGSIATYLNIEHNDIQRFLELKRNSGEERNRAHDVFPAVNLRELFFKRVKDNSTWSLFSSTDTRELESLYGDEWSKAYEALEQNLFIPRTTMLAKDLWKLILKEYFETGSPFLFNIDEAKRRNPNKHVGTIKSSNLCVTGDTYILTKDGYKNVFKMYKYGKELDVQVDSITMNGKRECRELKTFNTPPIVRTSVEAEIYEITFDDGSAIKSTSWHEYYVNCYDETVKLPLSLLKVGDVMYNATSSDTFGIYKPTLAELKGDVAILDKTGEFNEHWFQLSKSRIEALASIILDNTNFRSKLVNLRKLQMIFNTARIGSIIYHGPAEHNNNKVGTIRHSHFNYTKRINTIVKLEETEDVYDTTEVNTNSLIFNGTVTGNCTEIVQNTQSSKHNVKVTFEDKTTAMFDEFKTVNITIKPDGELIQVQAKYLQPNMLVKNKRIVFINNTIAKQAETAVCNLASINLGRVNTQEDLSRVVPIAIRLLDNVIDNNYYPIESAYNHAMKYRSIGLGMMGGAEYASKNKLVFGEQEHLEAMSKVYERFSFEAILASSELALERGSYEAFKGSSWSKGILPIDTANSEAVKLSGGATLPWGWLKQKVKADGMRNGYIMAVAPTSSISIIVGTTSTLEPIFKKTWIEDNKDGMIRTVVPNLNSDTWGYYKSAYEIDQVKLAEHNAILNIWLDQTASCNYFFNADTVTGRVLNDVFLRAFALGNKSTYYLRSTSPEVIVSDIGVDDEKVVECIGCQ